MRSYRSALLIVGAGVLTFGVVFTFLQVTRSQAAPDELVAKPTAAPPEVTPPVPVGRAANSLAVKMLAGQIAIGVPSVGSELLLQDIQSGDRLDVVASLPSPQDSRPVTAVLVRGATVLRPPTASDPLLLEVPATDAIVLAHLVLGGTRLGYVVWPADGSPPEQQPLDERTARALLGFAPTPSPVQVQPTPVVAPTSIPPPETYTVQAGDSLESVAARFGVDAGGLWWANHSLVDPQAPLVEGTILQMPSFRDFVYQVQPGDTWETVSATFRTSIAALQLRNQLPDDAALSSGLLLIIPRTS